jgi:hypothetical protein
MLFQNLATVVFGLAILSEAAVPPIRDVGAGLWKRSPDSNSRHTATCLSPYAIQTGSNTNGQQTPVSGQSPSQT